MRSEQIGAIPFPVNINANYGTETAFIQPPDNDRRNLVVYAQVGSVAIRAGNQTTAMAAISEQPSADITDGSAHVSIKEGSFMAFVAPEGVTLKGFTGTSVATYWWV
jgi:hypothetical protein